MRVEHFEIENFNKKYVDYDDSRQKDISINLLLERITRMKDEA